MLVGKKLVTTPSAQKPHVASRSACLTRLERDHQAARFEDLEASARTILRRTLDRSDGHNYSDDDGQFRSQPESGSQHYRHIAASGS